MGTDERVERCWVRGIEFVAGLARDRAIAFGASEALETFMRGSMRLLLRGALCAASALAGASGASADCVRHVYNRSPYVLVATQDGGPSFTVRPGTSRAIRLSRPGKLDLAGYCGLPGLRGDPAGLAQPSVQESFDYQAVLDRCYIEFGHDFFRAELGRGFLPYEGTQPFTLNNPRQGDIVLYAGRDACRPVR
jgi:hypothetical protein